MTDEREGGSTSPVEVSLKRDLGLVEVLMIGLGPNIGSTIFVLVGFGVQIAGPALLLSLILNFFVTLLTAVSYMELSSAFPETGGGYLWVREGLFPPLGFLGGWMSWIGHCIACAVYVLGFGEGVTWLMQQYGVSIVGIDPSILVKVFAVVIALVFTYMNYRGIKGAGRTQFYVSVILVGIIVIYLICALAAIFQNGIVTGAFDPFVPFGLMSIGSSMAFTFMIFEGYEIVAQTGEEAKDPERTVPKAMILCILISAVIFVVITAVTLAVSGWQEVAEGGTQAIAITAQKIVPVLGAALISIGTMIGSVAAINSVIFSTSRVSFAMGRDGTLPSVFGRLHAKNMTPYASIFFSAAIIIGISVTLPIEQVASVADILILILFVFVNAAAITLRKKRTDVKRRFITPFFPWIPVAGIITKMVLSLTLFEVEPLAWYFAIAVIYAGLAMYYFSRGKKEIEEIEVPAREAPTVESLKRYRVLLPIDDPGNFALVDLACILAKNRDGELLLTTVLEVPNNVSLSHADPKLLDDKKNMLEKVKLTCELKGVFTRAMVSVSHDVVGAIIDTAVEENARMIVMGWKGFTRTQRRILGRKMDEILHKTPCDVIVLRAEERFSPESILVLSGATWQASKATETAAEIARGEGSRITILNVIVDVRHLNKARSHAKRLKEIVEEEGVPVITKEIHPETIVGGVVAESLDYDLLVIGASGAKRWERFDFGPLLDRITKESKCPVLVYKRVAGTGTESRKRH